MEIAVIDTCCLINVYASQHPQAIVQAVFQKAIVPKEVVEESLFIRKPDDDDSARLVPSEVSFDELIATGTIEVASFEQEEELERFVRLATLLDDGEAACMTIASCRSVSLATDDRKAIAVANDLGVEVLTTPDILKRWIDTVSPQPQNIGVVIRNIERYGRFKPHYTSPRAQWWSDNSLTE